MKNARETRRFSGLCLASGLLDQTENSRNGTEAPRMGEDRGWADRALRADRQDWFWTVFDSDGEERESGRSASQALALTRATAIAQAEGQASLRVVRLDMADIRFSRLPSTRGRVCGRACEGSM